MLRLNIINLSILVASLYLGEEWSWPFYGEESSSRNRPPSHRHSICFIMRASIKDFVTRTLFSCKNAAIGRKFLKPREFPVFSWFLCLLVLKVLNPRLKSGNSSPVSWEFSSFYSQLLYVCFLLLTAVQLFLQCPLLGIYFGVNLLHRNLFFRFHWRSVFLSSP